MSIKIIEREISTEELKAINSGFDELAIEAGNPIEQSERITFVAEENNQFIGSISGLAYKEGDKYNPYLYITDLYLNKSHRRLGIVSQLLNKFETKIKSMGIKYIWTWTAGYEGYPFYLKQGYQVFTEMTKWYQSGHSRYGMIKELLS